MKDANIPHPAMVERIIALARRLRTIKRPAEAAELLEIAAAMSPKGAALRDEASRMRDEEGIEDFDREFKRRNLEASHALGMAHILENQGDFSRTLEMIDLAKLRTPFNYLAYAAAGYLYLRHEDATAALQEFIQARRLNPLDFRLAVETSRAALESEQFDIALEHAVDAMLLSQWRSEHEQDQERRRIDTLARLCQRKNKDMEILTKQRAGSLQKALDHVSLIQTRIFSGSKVHRGRRAKTQAEKPADNLLQRATELRSMPLFRHFADDQLIALAKIIVSATFKHAEVLFREDHDGRDLFILERGTVHVTRKTPVGTQILTTMGFGSLFGEISYLDQGQRSATAFGVGDGSFLRLPAAALDHAMQVNRELAVSMLWSFWKTLADKVRSANGQMAELFAFPDTGSTPARVAAGGDRVHLSEKDKLELLREQGLSAQELRLLATYSREDRFASGSLIFGEGEPGESLYIVVDGSVRISRVFPGFGEECLSILERGEVFGEMALIDEQPRSADARAHTGGATVFSISRSFLEEVLSMDPDAAVQFMTLLCRLLCRRLRAMNDRLVAWRVMAAHE